MTGRRRSAGRGRGLSVSESLLRPAPGLAASLSPNGVRDQRDQFSDAHPANRGEDGEYNIFVLFFFFFFCYNSS